MISCTVQILELKIPMQHRQEWTLHIIYRLQLKAWMDGFIASLHHHQVTISPQHPCSTNATQTGNLPSQCDLILITL